MSEINFSKIIHYTATTTEQLHGEPVRVTDIHVSKIYVYILHKEARTFTFESNMHNRVYIHEFPPIFINQV